MTLTHHHHQVISHSRDLLTRACECCCRPPNQISQEAKSLKPRRMKVLPPFPCLFPPQIPLTVSVVIWYLFFLPFEGFLWNFLRALLIYFCVSNEHFSKIQSLMNDVMLLYRCGSLLFSILLALEALQNLNPCYLKTLLLPISCNKFLW